MAVQIDDTLYLHFATRATDTGVPTSADSTPSGAVYEENGITSMYTPTITLVTTGRYVATLVVTAANGFENNKTYNVWIIATIGGVLQEAVIETFSVSGTLDANVTEIGGDAQSAADLKDFVDTGYDPTTHKVQKVALVDTTTDLTSGGADIAAILEDTDTMEADLKAYGDANWGSSGSGGSGTETVTVDYGGTNALQGVDASGVPIACTIIAYLTTDYDAGNTGTGYIQGRVTQYADGTWSNPLQLNVNTYTLVYYKDEYQVATQSLVVT